MYLQSDQSVISGRYVMTFSLSWNWVLDIDVSYRIGYLIWGDLNILICKMEIIIPIIETYNEYDVVYKE